MDCEYKIIGTTSDGKNILRCHWCKHRRESKYEPSKVRRLCAKRKKLPHEENGGNFGTFASLPLVVLACPYRGEVTGSQTCQLCGNRGAVVEIATCEKFGTCTPRKYKAGQSEASCLTCAYVN